MEKFVAGHPDTPGGLVGAARLPEFVAALKKPRKIIILVKAGPPVDAVVEQLLGAGVEKDDIVVDCGNSLWTDTIRREKQYEARCRFFGSGVSGGEIGARFGPSLMPGGDPESWKHLQPIWEADRRQGGSPRPASRSRTMRRASPSRAACPAPPTSAPTAPGTT